MPVNGAFTTKFMPGGASGAQVSTWKHWQQHGLSNFKQCVYVYEQREETSKGRRRTRYQGLMSVARMSHSILRQCTLSQLGLVTSPPVSAEFAFQAHL